MADESSGGSLTIPPGIEEFFIESVVREKIIDKWESQDEPEHLKTIKTRILYNQQSAGRLLGLYQQILQSFSPVLSQSSPLFGDQLSSLFVREAGGIPTDDSPEQIELLLSGLVVRNNGYLQVRNRIYAEVFNLDWVEKKLEQLRPYSQTFAAWIASQQTDASRLLRGKALQDAQSWAQEKSLSNLDYQFLAASAELDRQEAQLILEAERTKEVEARLVEQQQRLIQEKKAAKRQRLSLFAVSIALIIATILGVVSYGQYRQAQTSEQEARISEIKALTSSAAGLFASHQRLDALLEAIQAQRRLQQLGRAGIKVQEQVTKVLQQVVYENDEYNRLSGHQAAVMTVDISPNSQLIASASVDKTVRLWRRDSKAMGIFQGHQAMVRTVKFSPDGQIIASASEDGTVKLWQQDGTLVRTIETKTSGLWGLAWNPDGQIFASSSMDGTIKLWRRDGSLIRTLLGHRAGVSAIVFSPDGQMLVSGSGDRTIKLWKLDGTLVQTLKGHTASVWRVAFSPDGKMIASGSGDNTVKIWTRDGQLLRTLAGHTAAVWGVAFSPDSQTIATGSVDNTVKLWRLDGQELTTLRGHSASIRGLVYSGDGKFVATVSEDNTLILWNVQQVLGLDVLNYGCDRVRDYLHTNTEVLPEDKSLCDQPQ